MRNRRLMEGESEYYLTSFESALTFIEKMDKNTLLEIAAESKGPEDQKEPEEQTTPQPTTEEPKDEPEAQETVKGDPKPKQEPQEQEIQKFLEPSAENDESSQKQSTAGENDPSEDLSLLGSGITTKQAPLPPKESSNEFNLLDLNPTNPVDTAPATDEKKAKEENGEAAKLKLEDLKDIEGLLYHNQSRFIKFEDKDQDSIFLSDVNNLLYEYKTMLKNYKKISEAVKNAISDQ